MTEAALQLHESTPSAEAWGWLGVVVRWLRAESRSPTEQALVDAVQHAAGLIGGSVLDATELTDADERLDAALENPNLYRLNAEIGRLLTFDAFKRTRRPQPAPVLVEILGAGPARVFAEALELEMASASAVAQLLTMLPGVLEEMPPLSLASFYEPNTPSIIQRAAFEALRSVAASLSIVQAIATRRKLEPWLGMKLAEVYRRGLYEHLRLLVMVPGVVIAERILPMEDRFNLLEIEAAHTAAVLRLERLADEAHAAGGFLTSSDDDDPPR